MVGGISPLPHAYIGSSIHFLDNPESDIAGANAAGWDSVLVKTGVYDPFQGTPTHLPTHVAEDVEEAVKWAIKRELKRIRFT
jgi:FMN phosphatase YigB (HAD superfamily)